MFVPRPTDLGEEHLGHPAVRGGLVQQADPQQRGDLHGVRQVELGWHRRQQRVQVDTEHARRRQLHRAAPAHNKNTGQQHTAQIRHFRRSAVIAEIDW